MDDEIAFYQREKLRFNELLSQLAWTEDCLLKEQEPLIQCPIDRGHRFPAKSRHVEKCQLIKEGFSKDYSKELEEAEQEKQLLNHSGISLTPSILSSILHRPITITNNFPLNVEQTTILFTPTERLSIAHAVHNEALHLGLVPSQPLPIVESLSIQSQNLNSSQQSNKSIELRDQKRRRAKYVTRTTRKSLYDHAREMINTGMEFISQRTQSTKHHKKRSKHKHRSSSKRKHHSSRSRSRKHHRHSKKRRTS